MERNEKIETNRGRFDELQKRHAIITSLYPDINNAPKSIEDEYWAINHLAGYLRRGIGNPTWGEMTTEDGLVIDSFQAKSYDEALKSYNAAHEQNAELITDEDIAKVELPQVDVDGIKSGIESATSREDLYGHINHIVSMKRVCTLDELFELEEMDKYANSRLVELGKQEEKVEESKEEEVEENKIEEEKPKGFWQSLKDKVKGIWNKIVGDKDVKKLDSGKESVSNEVKTDINESNAFNDSLKVKIEPIKENSNIIENNKELDNEKNIEENNDIER